MRQIYGVVKVAQRITNGQVYDVRSDLDSSLALTEHILTAVTITDRLDSVTTLSDAELERVELYLAVHFASLDQDKVVDRQIEGAQDKFATGKTGLKLDFTRWGQMAKLIDHTGTLDTMDSQRLKAAMFCFNTKYDAEDGANKTKI